MSVGSDKSGRLRLNPLDWLLLGLILLGLLLGAWYLWRQSRGAGERVELTVLLRLPAVERSLLESADGLFAAGSAVRNGNGTAVLGTVREVRVRERLLPAVREGGLVWAPDPQLADLEVTVRMTAQRQAGNGLRVQDLRIAAGGTGSFCLGNYFAAAAEIVWVEEQPDERTE